jgi:AcrR family transcriptional regulator
VLTLRADVSVRIACRSVQWARQHRSRSGPQRGNPIDETPGLATETIEPAGLPGRETPDGDDSAGALGRRAARTRRAILDAAQQLFLDLGYAGTRINNITDACGISRAGFYTYFKDKREVFTVLGETAYHDTLQVVGRWDDLPRPCSPEDVEGWVREYYQHLDQHGAFILASAQSAPTDEEFRASSRRLQMRVAWLLGVALRSRQQVPTDAPEALGLATQALLDRSWYQSRGQRLPVDDDDMIGTVTAYLAAILETT